MADTARIQKLITFSPQLYENVFAKARQLGLSFGEYIRYLAITDVKENIKNLPTVDAQTDLRIGESLKDLKNGRYTVINNKKELDAHLNSL